MNILNLTPNISGAYPPIQSWNGKAPPDGYTEVVCATTEFCAFRGFVTPTLTDGVVTAFEGNQAALDAYLAERPDNTEEPIDPMTTMQLALADLAEAQAADQTQNELAMAELAELVTGGGV